MRRRCCCRPIVIDCDGFGAFLATQSQCDIQLSMEAVPGCTPDDCAADLDGEYILSDGVLPCLLAGTGGNFGATISARTICGGPSVTGVVWGGDCVSSPSEGVLFFVALELDGVCSKIAEQFVAFPFDPRTGSMDPFAFASHCIPTVPVPWVLS